MAEAKKHYYIALLDTEANEIRFVPNTIKGRNTIVQFKINNAKAYKVTRLRELANWSSSTKLKIGLKTYLCY